MKHALHAPTFDPDAGTRGDLELGTLPRLVRIAEDILCLINRLVVVIRDDRYAGSIERPADGMQIGATWTSETQKWQRRDGSEWHSAHPCACEVKSMRPLRRRSSGVSELSDESIHPPFPFCCNNMQISVVERIAPRGSVWHTRC